MLEYGDIFLSSVTAENRKKLETLQNKGLHCALKRDNDASTNDMRDDVNLLKLKDRSKQHMLNFMFDMSQYNHNMQNNRTEGVKTRTSGKCLMKIKRPRTEKFKKSLAYHGPKKWNALPQNLQLSKSKGEFKLRLEARIIHKAKMPSE